MTPGTPDYAGNQTALETAGGIDTRRDILTTWLRERGIPATADKAS